MKAKERTYLFNMDCDNCGGAAVNIPYGTTIENFKANHHVICPNCGCLMIPTKDEQTNEKEKERAVTINIKQIKQEMAEEMGRKIAEKIAETIEDREQIR